MSKIVTIPTGGGNPFVVILGGVKYVYKPGETVEVPDGVALEIEEWERWHEKYYGENEPPFGAAFDITAEVGQTIVVEEVDDNGKPTEWEAADLPSGGAEYDAVFEGDYDHISGTSSWGITWTAGQLVFADLKAKMANFGKVRAMAKVFHPTLNRTYVAECVSTAYFDEYFGGTLGFTFVFDFGIHFSCYVSQYGDELNLSSTAPD